VAPTTIVTSRAARRELVGPTPEHPEEPPGGMGEDRLGAAFLLRKVRHRVRVDRPTTQVQGLSGGLARGTRLLLRRGSASAGHAV